MVPPDPRFVVDRGTILSHPRRDPRLPRLYTVTTHPLVDPLKHSLVKTIIVYVQDTDPKVREEQLKYEDTLNVPLGPDSEVINNGMLH
ncbi:hypothetical protein BDN72DRAFT_767921 [Pluteus cervinus]|uniref:Uncharacterized protein n=1 Tax=Pluteus cervinus TaxID=181527 RepID=A0ACD3AUK7_9AGAR|nr:hypothetical protein BDN72DRAFT_767921 [Pluteus cervinus]